jgi:putative flippase GtrA
MKFQNSEFSRFIIVGITTVLIDLLTYIMLVFFGLSTFFSKGISFSSGTLFAYFANKSYTFKFTGSGSVRFFLFTTLYTSTLILNVLSNELMINWTAAFDYSILVAFFFATFISASLNFIGMKFIVFKKGVKEES